MSRSPHVPDDHGIYLDHLAHWVPDLEAAAAALGDLGFRLTPRTEHVHSPAPGAPPEPAGTANHCVMLREGYLEILSAVADTALAQEIRPAIARHTGVHLAAFCVRDAPAEHPRLEAAGFAQRPPVALERDAVLEDGRSVTLRFRVIRPRPGLLPEGRVQFITHDTPQWVWEPRWLGQPNGARALTDLLMCSDDVAECAGRYSRYLRTEPRHTDTGAAVLTFARGALTIMSPQAAGGVLGLHTPPLAPSMAAYAVRVDDIAATQAFLLESGHAPRAAVDGALVVTLTPALGGVMVFHDGIGPSWRE